MKIQYDFGTLNEWHHGSKHVVTNWPWWRLFSWQIVNLGVRSPSTGKRLLIYTRWKAFSFDIYFDRRNSV